MSHAFFLLAWSGVHTRVGREQWDSWPPLNHDPNKRSRRERAWLEVSHGREPRSGTGSPQPGPRGLERRRGPAGLQSHRGPAPPGLPLSVRFAPRAGPPALSAGQCPSSFLPFLFLPLVHRTDLGVKYIPWFPDLLDSRGRWHAGRRGHRRGHPDRAVQALRSPRAGSASGERAVPPAGSRGGDRARAVSGHRGTVTL